MEVRGLSSISQILHQTDLIDLYKHCDHPTKRPPPYNQGSQIIDFCFGSPEFASALAAAWYYLWRTDRTLWQPLYPWTRF